MKSTGLQRAESRLVVVIRVCVAHTACLGVLLVPVTPELLSGAAIGFVVRMWSIEVGAHRYFSHRSFRTSRAFQFVLAALVAASGQRGALWWASHHRTHHRHSDGALDPHSPVTRPFWYAHLGWLLDQRTLDTDLDAVRDLSRYPELVWINKFHMVFALATLLGTFVVGQATTLFGRSGLGASAVVWTFFVATVLSMHATFAVNTLTHGVRPGLFHKRRYALPDTTTNAWWLALPTLGAAWHNNHHRYMNAARAGFYWWEIDLSYASLKLLQWLRIVRDLHPVPAAVLAEGRRRPAMNEAEV
jgi:stearoyl-CoA desaturase (delta-9 desaturase)